MVTNTSGCIAVCDETVARMVVWLLPAISGATNLLSWSLCTPRPPNDHNPLRMAECATVIGKPSHRAGRGGRLRRDTAQGQNKAAAHLELNSAGLMHTATLSDHASLPRLRASDSAR